MNHKVSKNKPFGIRSYVAVSLFSLALAVMAFYTKDLSQKNPESIFLTKSGLQDYKEFDALVHNPQALIAKIEFDHNIDSSDINYAMNEFEKIRKKYGSQVKLLDYRSVYQKSVLFKSDKEAIGYFSRLKKGTRLLGGNYISMILVEKLSMPKQLIKDLYSKKYFDKKSIKVKIAGHPYTNFLLDMNSKDIKDFLFPLMFLFAFLIIFYINRSLLQTILIFFPGLFSALLGLTSIKYLFLDMNMITSIIPLLLFVINLSLSLHLFYGLSEYLDLKAVLKLKIKPLFLMILTTSVGFGSLGISEIVVIKQFALLSSALIGISGVMTLFWFIMISPFLQKLILKKTRSQTVGLIRASFFKTGPKARYIYIVSSLFLGLSYFFVGDLSIITDATLYFSEKSGFKKDIDDVSTTVSGIPLYEIIIKSNNGGFDYKELSLINSLEKRIYKVILKDEYLLSMNTLVQDTSYHYSGNNQFPNLKFLYFPMRSALLEDMKKAYPLGEYYRITILGNTLNSDVYTANLEKIKKVLNNGNGHKYQINGLYYNLMNSQEAMVTILAKSFLLSLLIVCFISFIYYRNLKVLWIFFIVNTIPVSITVFLMYLFDLSLNIATVMTFSISMGMIVDSSLHIIHILDQRLVTFNEYIETTVKPVVLSSLLFIFCFSSFGFMGFMPIREFGIILSIMLSLGLLFDLYILPSLYIGSVKIDSYFNKKRN